LIFLEEEAAGLIFLEEVPPSLSPSMEKKLKSLK
jgi:hypothetical protein